MNIKNVDGFQDWLKTASQKEKIWARRMLGAVGLNGVNYIRNNWSPSSPSAPGATPAVVTGALSASIGYTVDDYRVMLTASEIYAEYLEFGTIHMDARPFFQLAFQYLKDKFPEFARDVGFE